MKIIYIILASFFIVACDGTTREVEVNNLVLFNDDFNYAQIGNNPFFDKHNAWYLYPTPQNIDINVSDAWKNNNVGKDVVVAVIDVDFDYLHEDLKNATIYHKQEHTDKNATHGNMCAGIIGARSNNVGSIGVAPSSKLVLIGTDIQSDIEKIEAFETAKEKGASVINASWGGYHVSDALTDEINDLATNARSNKGIVIVFASGNHGRDLDAFNIDDESELENVIGVGWIDKNEMINAKSNYGSALDLVAPGSDIIGPCFSKDEQKNSYCQGSGTSFAAPQVAGAAAIILGINPNLKASEVAQILKKTATKIGTYGYENGHNKYYGYGKLNVSLAAKEAKSW